MSASSANQKQETIALDVLRVASGDVLGQTKPLAVARPFSSSNAKGHLKEVDCLADIGRIALASATEFKAAMKVKATK